MDASHNTNSIRLTIGRTAVNPLRSTHPQTSNYKLQSNKPANHSKFQIYKQIKNEKDKKQRKCERTRAAIKATRLHYNVKYHTHISGRTIPLRQGSARRSLSGPPHPEAKCAPSLIPHFFVGCRWPGQPTDGTFDHSYRPNGCHAAHIPTTVVPSSLVLVLVVVMWLSGQTIISVSFFDGITASTIILIAGLQLLYSAVRF